MKKEVILIVVVFIIGFSSSFVFIYLNAYIKYSGKEAPSSITGFASFLSDKSTPSDRIKESQINVYDNRVVIVLDNATMSSYADTRSMEPLINSYSNGIETIPKSENDLKVGDIVVYENEQGPIVHRVIYIGEDRQGKYFLVKGDNNKFPDEYKIRFAEIKYVLIGILY